MSAPYVHLEGMGVLGSLLALCLERARVNFTWHDTEAAVTAWRASTGCVYPVLREGDEQRSYLTWLRWLSSGLVPPCWRCTEQAVPWFTGARAPHGGSYPPTVEVGALRADPQFRSVHVNAQRLVPLARQRFAARRLPGSSPKARHHVVAHGFNARLDHYSWGWSRPVALVLPRALRQQGLRPSIGVRQGRFVWAYAYPMPGTALWYAGSSMVHQRAARPLDAAKHYVRWLRTLGQLTGTLLGAAAAGAPLQGWRPAGAGAFGPAMPRVEHRGRQLLVPPLNHSGVRLAPVVVEQVFDALKLPRGTVLP